jgi:hypothetical protein
MRGFKGSPQWARYKNKKRLLRKGLIYTPNSEFTRLIEDRGKDFIAAPENFSLVDNPGGVIEYFRSVQDNAKLQIQTVMDMRSVDKTDLATISLLISVMMDRRKSAKAFKRSTTIYIPPAQTEPGRLFRKAQFHETVTAHGIADHAFFLSRRSTKVNEEYLRDVLNYAEKFLSVGNPGKLSPLLVEIISNTNNHANPDVKEEEDRLPWFLSVLEDKDTGKMIFSVVDLGVGIFESLKMKGLASTDNFEDSIKDMYQNSQSKFLRTNIPEGVNSSTGLYYRGKGLQTIYEYAKNAIYDKFTIITNKAVVNLKNTNQNTVDSGDSLDGTVYYWEMSSNGKF